MNKDHAPEMRMVGESVLIVEFGRQLSRDINDAVLAFDRGLQDHTVEGLLECTPTGTSIALRFDPLQVTPDRFRHIIRELVADMDLSPGSGKSIRRCWRLPVLYGGEAGPDLDFVAAQMSCSADEVVQQHQATRQRVFMVGFAPGFLYTGLLPERFHIPRLPEIKPKVPAGSVSIAIGQTVVSSTAHPTGWHTIGRTPFVNFDPGREPPVVIRAGDEIEFCVIDAREYKDRTGQTELESFEI